MNKVDKLSIVNISEGYSIYKLYSESEIFFAKIKHRNRILIALQNLKDNKPTSQSKSKRTGKPLKMGIKYPPC